MCLSYPVRVLSIEPDGTALTDVSGAHRRVPLLVVTSGGDTVRPGDWLLVQSGLAVARISPAEAAAQLRLLDQAQG